MNFLSALMVSTERLELIEGRTTFAWRFGRGRAHELLTSLELVPGDVPNILYRELDRGSILLCACMGELMLTSDDGRVAISARLDRLHLSLCVVRLCEL